MGLVMREKRDHQKDLEQLTEELETMKLDLLRMMAATEVEETRSRVATLNANSPYRIR